MQETLDGVTVVWMNKVSDDDHMSPLGEASAQAH
jgi:hypothetical protein